MSEFTFDKKAVAPSAPDAGETTLYFKNDGLGYIKDGDTGTESKLGDANVNLANNIYVSTNGNDTTGDGKLSSPFRTGKAASEYIRTNFTLSATNAFIIKYSAGLFEEDPFTLDEYMGIVGEGYRTVIKAKQASANLITSEGSHTIANLIIYGVTGASNYCVSVNLSSSSRIAFQNVNFNPYKQTGETISNGVLLSCLSGELVAEFENCDFDQVTGDCIYMGSGAKTVTDGINIFSCSGTFVDARNDSTYELDGVKVIGSLGLGVNHLSTGQGTFGNVDFRNATSPMNKTNNAPILIKGASGTFADATISTLENFSGFFYDEFEGSDFFRILNNTGVGIAGLGKEFYTGEGAHSLLLKAYTYDGSVFVDKTTEAISTESSTLGFPATGSTRAIYLASVATNESDSTKVKHLGFEAIIDTAASSDGEIVAEVLTSSGWVEFNSASYQADRKHYPYAKEMFQRTGKEDIHYNGAILSSWITSDPVGLGVNLYWMRLRIETAPTTSPLIERIRLHTNSEKKGVDGFSSFYGLAKPIISEDISGFQPANASPASNDIYITDTTNYGKIENNFQTTTDRVGKEIYLRNGVCSACPVMLKAVLYPQNSNLGDIDFNIRWKIQKNGIDSGYPSTTEAPSTDPNVQSTSVSVTPLGQYKKVTLSAMIDISDYISDNADGTPDSLVIVIERDGGNDDYTGNVLLGTVEIFFALKSLGGHI